MLKSRKSFSALLGTVLIIAVLVISFVAPAIAANTANPSSSSEFSVASQPLTTNVNNVNIKFFPDGSFSTGDSTEVPHIFEGAKHYGMVVSEVVYSDRQFKAAVFDSKIQKSSDDMVLLEAAASGDNGKWSEWEQADSNGVVNFLGAYNSLQYRITIISSSSTPPTVKVNSFKLEGVSPADIKAFNSSLKPLSLGPCLEFATREGLIGRTTANGHVIKSTDVFVALPSGKGLCPSDKNNIYTVNITYNGKPMTNIPVWDVGPFNIYDDYWNPNSSRSTWGYAGYGNLPQGSSEEWYAYTYNFHNGWTSSCPYSGQVTAYVSDSDPGTQVHNTKANPNTHSSVRNNGASIDLSDGVLNYLGIPLGTNVNVSVTYNWL